MIEHTHRLIYHGASYEPIGAACGIITELKQDDLRHVDLHKRVMVVSKLLTHPIIIEHLAFNGLGLDVRSVHRKRKSGKPALAANVDVVLVHPEMVGKVLLDAPKRFFDTLIVVHGGDFKHPRTARFIALRRRAKDFARRYVYTLRDHNLMELWSQVSLVDLGASLGLYRTEFYNRYCEPHGFQGREWRVRDTAVGEIMGAISSVTDFIVEPPT